MVAGNPSAGKLDVSVIEYHRLGERGHFATDVRVELINGEILTMTPIGSRHAGTVKRLSKRFNEMLGHRFIVSVQDPVVLGEYSEPEPDLALLLPRSDFYSASHPTAVDMQLLVEVADSGLQHELEAKLPLYASNGIPELWVVDLEGKQLMVFTQPAGDRYDSLKIACPHDAVAPLVAPDITLDLSDLFQ